MQQNILGRGRSIQDLDKVARGQRNGASKIPTLPIVDPSAPSEDLLLEPPHPPPPPPPPRAKKGKGKDSTTAHEESDFALAMRLQEEEAQNTRRLGDFWSPHVFLDPAVIRASGGTGDRDAESQAEILEQMRIAQEIALGQYGSSSRRHRRRKSGPHGDGSSHGHGHSSLDRAYLESNDDLYATIQTGDASNSHSHSHSHGHRRRGRSEGGGGGSSSYWANWMGRLGRNWTSNEGNEEELVLDGTSKLSDEAIAKRMSRSVQFFLFQVSLPPYYTYCSKM